jgi:putative tryptophan/tyrosine transport system substrate-binding protein
MQSLRGATCKQRRARLVYNSLPLPPVAIAISMTFFSTARERQVEALLVTADGLFFGLPDKLATLAARHALPTFYPLSDYARAGGLISYGANLSESWRQAGIYVGKIVKGTKVTDLPIIQPTKFELVINMKTAKALDLDVPPYLQQLADEVIE